MYPVPPGLPVPLLRRFAGREGGNPHGRTGRAGRETVQNLMLPIMLATFEVS
ncbi:hypothetical protein STEPF1_04887 [Streptomyces sp. F-1]|nr:hypothetical protein STEPF1_04887 [Streptomyces sp. F-1]